MAQVSKVPRCCSPAQLYTYTATRGMVSSFSSRPVRGVRHSWRRREERHGRMHQPSNAPVAASSAIAVHAATTEVAQRHVLSTRGYLAELRQAALTSRIRVQCPRDGPFEPLLCSLTRGIEQQLSAVALAIAQRGFCVCRSGLAPNLIHDAAREARALFAARKMQPAYFGKASAGGEREEATRREDHNLWLHNFVVSSGSNDAIAAGAGTLATIDKLLADIGQAVMEKLVGHEHDGMPLARDDAGEPIHCTGRTDGMVAVYPGGGASYGAHLDNIGKDGRDDLGRCLTAVFYLNPSWRADIDGGALRVYAPVEAPPPLNASAPVALVAVEVPPIGGDFILFRSEQLVHEVMPAHAERCALTVWMHGGTKKQARGGRS